jgi:hypothetical protein
MNTPRPLSIRRFLTGLLLQASLLLIVTTAYAVPIMTDHAPSHGRIIVEDFSDYAKHSRWSPIVTANGTIDMGDGPFIDESFILEGEFCGVGNKCLAPVSEGRDVLFRNLPTRTIFWGTDFIQPLGTSFTTWTVTGQSGVSVFSNLRYQPHFGFFDPRGLLSVQLHVSRGLDQNGDDIIELYRFDNIATFSVTESGGAGVLCAGLLALLFSRRFRWWRP